MNLQHLLFIVLLVFSLGITSFALPTPAPSSPNQPQPSPQQPESSPPNQPQPSPQQPQSLPPNQPQSTSQQPQSLSPNQPQPPFQPTQPPFPNQPQSFQNQSQSSTQQPQPSFQNQLQQKQTLSPTKPQSSLKSEKFQQTSTSNVKSTNESPEKAYNKQFDSDVSKSRNKILSSNAHEPIQKVGKETKSEVDTSTPRKNSSNSIEIVIASIGTLIFSILIASGFRRYRQKNKLQQVVEEVKLATLPENILPILEEEEVDFREQKIDGDEREQEPKQNQLYVLITPGLIL